MKTNIAFISILIVSLLGSVPAYALTGRVMDSQGRPIWKADVVVHATDRATSKEVTQVAHTDPMGHFEFSVKGNAHVTATGYSVWGGAIEEDNQTIILFKEVKQQGRVIDANGKPIPGAVVRVDLVLIMDPDRRMQSRSGNRDGGGKIPDVATGKDGSFVLRHLPNVLGITRATVIIRVTKPGMASIVRMLDERSLGNNLEIILPVEGVIEGRILRDGEEAAPQRRKLNAAFYLEDRSPQEVRAAMVNGNGEYLFGELPSCDPIIYEPRLGDAIDDWVLPIVRVSGIQAGSKKTINLREVRSAKIRGQVVDKEGNSVSEAHLMVTDASSPEGRRWIVCDRNGKFALAVAPGEIRVEVSEDRGSALVQSEGRSFRLGPGEEMSDVSISIERNPPIPEEFSSIRPSKPNLILLPGTYKLVWDEDLNLQGVNSGIGKSGEDIRPKLKGLARLISTRPYLAAYRCDVRQLVVVLDESGGTGTGYDTAYIDTNRNMDISDEKPLSLKADASRTLQQTEWVRMVALLGSEQRIDDTHRMKVRLEVSARDQNHLFVRPTWTGGWRGDLESNRGPIEFVPVDSDLNGAYNDLPQHALVRDIFFMGVSGAGKVVITRDSRHRFVENRVSLIDGRLYNLFASETGDQLSVVPYSGSYGLVALTADDIGGMKGSIAEIEIYGDTGVYDLHDVKAPFRLPSGEYTVLNCRLELHAEGRPAISLVPMRPIEVRTNETLSLAFTGKIAAQVDAQKDKVVLFRGGKSQFSWALTLGDWRKLREPPGRISPSDIQVRLFDPQNRLVFNGYASRWGGIPSMYATELPNIAEGEYTMQVSLDTRSELGIISSMRKVTVASPEKKTAPPDARDELPEMEW